MKLSPRDANAFFTRPDPSRPAILIYGADAMRVALKRQDLVAALIGPQGEDEMRLSRLAGSDLRKDPAALIDATKEVGFFPGPRVVLVDEATDGTTNCLSAALNDWREGDAMMVVTAGTLAKRSKLRKLFEDHRSAYVAAIYDDPPNRQEIEAELSRAGLTAIAPEAMMDLETLARALDPGDFRQTLEKIALYKIGDTSPLSSAEVALLAPATVEAGMDEILHAVAEGRQAEIGPLMSRLSGQGVLPVTLLIMGTRHFRALHAAAAHPNGPSAGIAAMRPPIFGPRRDKMQSQAREGGGRRLERALSALLETDLSLRSAGQTAPQNALVERLFLRLSSLKNARI